MQMISSMQFYAVVACWVGAKEDRAIPLLHTTAQNKRPCENHLQQAHILMYIPSLVFIVWVLQAFFVRPRELAAGKVLHSSTEATAQMYHKMGLWLPKCIHTAAYSHTVEQHVHCDSASAE